MSTFKQACNNLLSSVLGTRVAYPLALAVTKIGMRGLGINGGYELHESGERWLLEKTLPAMGGAVIADVGANVGEFSLLARQLGAAQVWAFEPAEKTFSILQAATAGDGQISCRRTAVGERIGETEFYIPIDDAASALASRDIGITAVEPDRARKLTVPLTTLDHESNGGERRFDLIKIDVEGFELDVLRGASGLVERSPPAVIMFEFNSHHLNRAHSLPMFAELLREYSFYRLARWSLRPLMVGHYLSTIYAYQNIVAIHRSAKAVRDALGVD
jgi:FkbM family methyltransferase